MASQEMHSIPLYIDQTGGLSVGQLAARARRLKRQKGLDLLILDYLQLLQGFLASIKRKSGSRDH
jgi:replicative DNA helicase